MSFPAWLGYGVWPPVLPDSVAKYVYITGYGVAMISRLLRIAGFFCKRALQKRRYSAKETWNFKEPTNPSHPIATPSLTASTAPGATELEILFSTALQLRGGYLKS